MTILGRISSAAQAAISTHAQVEARRLLSGVLYPEHLAIGILRNLAEQAEIVAEILRLPVSAIIEDLAQHAPCIQRNTLARNTMGDVSLSRRAFHVLGSASEIAEQEDDKCLRIDHLVSSDIQHEDGAFALFLERRGCGREIADSLDQALRGTDLSEACTSDSVVISDSQAITSLLQPALVDRGDVPIVYNVPSGRDWGRRREGGERSLGNGPANAVYADRVAFQGIDLEATLKAARAVSEIRAYLATMPAVEGALCQMNQAELMEALFGIVRKHVSAGET